MDVISKTGYAPKVLESRDNYLIAEYIEGVSFADAYRSATMSDDEHALENLASRLCIFLQMFYSLNEGLILGKADFDDFIMVDDRCCCVSFSGVTFKVPVILIRSFSSSVSAGIMDQYGMSISV